MGTWLFSNVFGIPKSAAPVVISVLALGFGSVDGSYSRVAGRSRSSGSVVSLHP